MGLRAARSWRSSARRRSSWTAASAMLEVGVRLAGFASNCHPVEALRLTKALLNSKVEGGLRLPRVIWYTLSILVVEALPKFSPEVEYIGPLTSGHARVRLSGLRIYTISYYRYRYSLVHLRASTLCVQTGSGGQRRSPTTTTASSTTSEASTPSRWQHLHIYTTGRQGSAGRIRR
jgi:hypothetical protein